MANKSLSTAAPARAAAPAPRRARPRAQTQSPSPAARPAQSEAQGQSASRAAAAAAAAAHAAVAMPEIEAIADRLHSAAIHLLRRVRRVDLAIGLTPARLSVLSVLVFGGPKTLGELATAEQVSAPTITRLVAGLERDRLLRRDSDPHDRRVVRVAATPRAARIMLQGRQARIRELATSLATLAPDDLALLGRATEILRDLNAR
jgi:DNA-binding MarR family transcriptional regulator